MSSTSPGHCAEQAAFLWQGERLLIAGDVGMNILGLGDPVGFEDIEEGRRSQRKAATYLRHGRPQSTSRRVFLRAKAPTTAFEVPVASDRSFGIASCAPSLTLPLTEHTSFAMDWPPSCCDKAPRSVRSASCWDLLQAGVDRSVIALWLGHEHVETTQIYLEATLAMKEKTLARHPRPMEHRGVTNPAIDSSPFLSSL